MKEGFAKRMVESRKGLNRDVIKYIAIVAMMANHIASIFLDSGTLLRMILLGIGDFTAITMCYFLVEGYSYTHSKKSIWVVYCYLLSCPKYPIVWRLQGKGL